ncbi:hypothetical protein VTO42DRAFT_4530 [Malbranchea cinnamomea]
MSTSDIHNLHGQFKPSGPKAEPPPDHGKHAPATKVNSEDNMPTFSARTVPPGTAPQENLFQPNPTETVPSQALNEQPGPGIETTQTTASSTLGGATSQDVHKGMGKPVIGQTSAELRHEGQAHRKHPGTGLEGVGASETGTRGVDARRLESERDEDVALHAKRVDPSQKGPPNIQDKGVPAEAQQPTSAESVASERQKHGGKHEGKPVTSGVNK